jgi:diaminopimelate decarboxylase
MLAAELLNSFEQLETPFYYYDLQLLKSTIKQVCTESAKHNYYVHYAIKANCNDRILEIIKDSGLGADCVSGNEVVKAIEMGFAPEEIVFAGVGKSDKEINSALQEKIFGFNCESQQELEVIDGLAASKNMVANVSLRINPNVDAGTHHNITTGLEENKFGINLWELEEVIDKIRSAKNLKLIGLHFHIGSQITDLNRYTHLCQKVNEINRLFIDKGLQLEHINMGGGLGINYEKPLSNLISDFGAYFQIFKNNLALKSNQKVHFELGRAIVGQCGTLISRVLYEKVGRKRHFLILDAGMTELMRPALYQAHHYIENLDARGQEEFIYDVVGPICETTDAFARDLTLPKSKRGDLIAIYSAGAYGEVLKSRYNLRDEIRAVYSDELLT